MKKTLGVIAGVAAAVVTVLVVVAGPAAADWKGSYYDSENGGFEGSRLACERAADGWRSSDLGARCQRVESYSRWDLHTFTVGY
ncbi:hypothetical protein [Nocardia sp. NPDC004750]